jgi:sulfotransferase family protein
VFVVGCGRSGTTLLRLMLDAHPDLAIPPESHFLSRFGHAVDRYRAPGGGVDPERLAGDILRTKNFAAWGVPEYDVRSRVRSLSSPASFADVIDAVYTAYAEPRGASRWGDKTPRYVMDIPLFDRLIPGSRFVHIVRDGRDVAMSLRSVRFGPNDPMGAAGFWARRVRAGRRDGGRLGAGRYAETRYEALIADPERELRAICGVLDLPWDRAMLDYHRGVDAALPEDRRPQHRHEDRPPTAGLRDWRTQMPPAEVAAFEAVAGDLLDELGYERGAPPPGPGLRVKAAWHVASGRVKRRLWGARRRSGRIEAA